MPGLQSCRPCVESWVSSIEAELSPRSVPPWGLWGLQPHTGLPNRTRGCSGLGAPCPPQRAGSNPLPAPLLRVSGPEWWGGCWCSRLCRPWVRTLVGTVGG